MTRNGRPARCLALDAAASRGPSVAYEFIYEFVYMKNIVKSYPKSCAPRFQMLARSVRDRAARGRAAP